MPVNAITMPYLSAVSMTLSSRMLPPGSATYLTPLWAARSMLSPKGKKASLPRETPPTPARKSRFSFSVSSSRMKRSISLSHSARLSEASKLSYMTYVNIERALGRELMGADAVMVNTAIATAADPARMAHAFKLAVEAGRAAYVAGGRWRGSWESLAASPTSPLTAFLEE